MSEAQRGDARAQGALANFIAGMKLEMTGGFNRSPEYQEQFWNSLKAEMQQFIEGKVN